MHKIKKGKLIAVTSVKGGVGKTTFILTLASYYEKMGKKVLIVDEDLYGGDIEAILNKEASSDLYTLFEDYTNNNVMEINSYITEYSSLIHFIASPKDLRSAGKMNSKFLNFLCNLSTSRYDVILFDTNNYLNEINLTTLDLCDSILYVINNNSMNLKNMRSMLTILEEMNINKHKILLYNAREKNRVGLSSFDMKGIMKENIQYVISDDFYIKNLDKHIIEDKFMQVILKQISHKNLKVIDRIAEDLIK